ncbi:trypsin-like peptidase domain-containing protein [Sphingomonas lacunae]|uniref:Serine protease n=1 Tax=Sphingomonas lacunae TaxID=2698828 RepID=A0A6M4ASE5_9SPHN|nr:serine protease [Sphingomonas lacunae]QJQ31974.1 trypsin-like peptidase domain-containing protein [Sphingomonas lacunae]
MNRLWAGAAMALTAAGCTGPSLVTPAGRPVEQQPVAAAGPNDPYANVCHLQTERVGLGGDGGSGSAVLYRGRYLITAAHNVSSPIYNRVTRIEVRCGRRIIGDSAPDFILTGREWATANGYRWRRYSHDLGVIRLPRELPTSTPVELASDVPPAGAVVELAGYPGAGIADTRTMYAATGPVVADSRRGRLSYFIRTTTGNSGGPVWQRDGSRLRLVGIHVVGYRSAGAGARRVDDWFVRQVNAMIRELDARASRSRGERR